MTGDDPLETDRLTLRPYTWDDLEDLARILGDPVGMVTMGGAFDLDGTRSWIERNLQRQQQDGFSRYAVILGATGELVGDCGLITTSVEGESKLELGWIVDAGLRRQGIATEAATAWRNHAFGDLGVAGIVSMIDEENTPSRRVAEKIGMSVERTALWGDGLPYLMYAMSNPRA